VEDLGLTATRGIGQRERKRGSGASEALLGLHTITRGDRETEAMPES
jgi:hypothetical protein